MNLKTATHLCVMITEYVFIRTPTYSETISQWFRMPYQLCHILLPCKKQELYITVSALATGFEWCPIYFTSDKRLLRPDGKTTYWWL